MVIILLTLKEAMVYQLLDPTVLDKFVQSLTFPFLEGSLRK